MSSCRCVGGLSEGQVRELRCLELEREKVNLCIY